MSLVADLVQGLEEGESVASVAPRLRGVSFAEPTRQDICPPLHLLFVAIGLLGLLRLRLVLLSDPPGLVRFVHILIASAFLENVVKDYGR